MPVLLIIIALLLLIFGGGCTLIMAGLVLYDPASAVSDAALTLSLWLPLGLAPLVAGYFLMRLGIRLDRARRSKATTEPAKDA